MVAPKWPAEQRLSSWQLAAVVPAAGITLPPLLAVRAVLAAAQPERPAAAQVVPAAAVAARSLLEEPGEPAALIAVQPELPRPGVPVAMAGM